MEKLLQLKESLSKINPVHDTPVGLVHPYWARKPLNIIDAIVENLSEPDDIVADPFMGSGTTLFSALSKKRNVLGSDINPLSLFVVQNILTLQEKGSLDKLQDFYLTFSENVLPWFASAINDKHFIERERFTVSGAFENGDFKLHATEIVEKKLYQGKWKSRTAFSNPDNYYKYDFNRSFLNQPLDFVRLKLRANSRIAVPRGALLSHFFTKRNQASINMALNLVGSGSYTEKEKLLLKLFLSSGLPLLRLSDKKASSQWPYWRPKKMLTSRNPVIALGKRLSAFRDATEWFTNNMTHVEFVTTDQLLIKPYSLSASVVNSSAQDLGKISHLQGSIDLVITDPPYADQAPYLEYSDLWLKILGLDISNSAFDEEIVKTDAPDRAIDNQNYLKRLKEGLESSSRLVKKDGYMALFYQDYDLSHWAGVFEATFKQGLFCLDVIALPKQRRSMKTVASPGATFDGDLLLIFKKDNTLNNFIESKVDIKDLTRNIILELGENSTLFEIYAAVLRSAFKEGWVGNYINKSVDIRKIIKTSRG